MFAQQGGKIVSLLRNPKVIHVISTGCIIAFGILYVGQVNAAATKGYAIRELEHRNEEIRQEQERLQVEIARLRSLDSVTKREAFLGLKKIENVEYISVGPNAFAFNQ